MTSDRSVRIGNLRVVLATFVAFAFASACSGGTKALDPVDAMGSSQGVGGGGPLPGLGGSAADPGTGGAGGEGGLSVAVDARQPVLTMDAPVVPTPGPGSATCGKADQACCVNNICETGGCCVVGRCVAPGAVCQGLGTALMPAGTCMAGACVAGAVSCGSAGGTYLFGEGNHLYTHRGPWASTADGDLPEMWRTGRTLLWQALQRHGDHDLYGQRDDVRHNLQEMWGSERALLCGPTLH